MELSTLRLQDAPLGGPVGERRRRIRHKLHTPVYASFNSPSTGLVLDLSELLDLNEDGFAVQTGERLEINQGVNLSLDLTETKTYVHCSGQVVWSDGTGRGGIRFSPLSDQSRKVLKEWLFLNLMIASTNRVARSQQAAFVEKPLRPFPPLEPSLSEPVPDLTGMLSAVEAVRREVHSAGDDVDAVLDLITERALSLTSASGAALAILTDDRMICRARAGEPAPGLGAAVDVKHGFSGECVRTGRTVMCEDTETDSRVDQEICRVLGIGSILAAPIFSDFRVVGLLEVFSPRPRSFTEVHQTALDRLVEIVPKVQKAPAEAIKPQETKTDQPLQAAVVADNTVDAFREALWEPERESQEVLKGVPIRPLHLALLALTAAVAALALGYLLAPTIEKWWMSKGQPAASQSVVSAANTPNANTSTKPTSLDELRTLAERGDADAQWNLGARYHAGDGVPQDDAQAVQWFLRAAEQGHLDSQATLGAYYWAGRGVREDLSEAYFWSVLALAQGDQAMKSRLEGLAARMTRTQVNATRERADEWLRRHHAGKAAAK